MRVRVGTHGYAGAFGLPGEGGSLRVKLKEICRCPGQAAVIPGFEFGVWDLESPRTAVCGCLRLAVCSLNSVLSPQHSVLSSYGLVA